MPNGIDLDLIHQVGAAAELTDLVVVGRLIQHKRVDMLLDALASLRASGVHLSCRIIGDGPARAALKEQARNLGIADAVEFRDDIANQKELYSLVKAAKVFVSLSAREGFGLAVLEAIACGIPVLTTSAPDNLAQHLVARYSQARCANRRRRLSRLPYTTWPPTPICLRMTNAIRTPGSPSMTGAQWQIAYSRPTARPRRPIAGGSLPNHGKLRIIQTPVMFFPAYGGVEKYVLELSKQLVALGNHVTVVCADEPHAESCAVQGVKAIRLPDIAKIANTNITPRLFGTLMSQNFDVIHTHIPTPWSADISALVSLLRRKRLLVTYHNDLTGQGVNGLIAYLYNFTFLHLILWRANKIVITQPSTLNTLRHLKLHKKRR